MKNHRDFIKPETEQRVKIEQEKVGKQMKQFKNKQGNEEKSQPRKQEGVRD